MDFSISALVFWALLALVVFAIVSKVLRKPYPIVMLVGGSLLALDPNLPPIQLAPDLVFLVMLPILLFGGAWTTDFRQFIRVIVPILWLALGLVVVTTVCVALLAHYWIGLPLGAAFVLGAILSPSDAIATEAIAEEIAFPQTTGTILSGESLVNDAAALVIYAFAVGAVMDGHFSPGLGILDFFYVSIGGLAIGIAVCAGMRLLSLRLRRAKLSDDLTGVLLSLVTPFMTYLTAQAAQTSGVLATVAGGVFLSARSTEIFTPEQRIAAGSVWQTVVFCLNGMAFILIGLQLRPVLGELQTYSAGTLLSWALGIAAVLIGVRFVLVFGGGLTRRAARKSRGLPVLPRPPWGELLITSWSGMRGIVTLAGALAIPHVTAAGAPFPGRAIILFLAFTTIVITLVGQGLTLPFIVARAPSQEEYVYEKDVAHAQLRAVTAARDRLRELEAGFETTEEWEAAGRLTGFLDARINDARKRLDGAAPAEAEPPPESVDRRLRLEIMAAERAELERLRKSGEITDRAFRDVQYEIDLLESMIKLS